MSMAFVNVHLTPSVVFVLASTTTAVGFWASGKGEVNDGSGRAVENGEDWLSSTQTSLTANCTGTFAGRLFTCASILVALLRPLGVHGTAVVLLLASAHCDATETHKCS